MLEMSGEARLKKARVTKLSFCDTPQLVFRVLWFKRYHAHKYRWLH